MRWSLIGMLAAVVLAVTRIRTTTATPGGRPGAPTARELLRLLRLTVLPARAGIPATSCTGPTWRRRHQQQAAECHQHWNNVTAAATT
jgi:hypothetical protein